MDAVYICRHGNNEELRFSIRSLQNLKQVKNVWVIGGKPKWYTGNHVEVTGSDKYNHAITNLHVLTKNAKISEKFVLMNDDFYVIKPVNKLEYYYEGTLSDKIVKYNQFNPNSKYTKYLQKTRDLLLKQTRTEPLSYELHIPMVLTKTGLKEALKYNVLWRSYFGNTNNVGGEEMKDVKIYHPTARDPNRFKYDANQHVSFISSEDRSFLYVRDRVLRNLFPQPSKYEE